MIKPTSKTIKLILSLEKYEKKQFNSLGIFITKQLLIISPLPTTFLWRISNYLDIKTLADSIPFKQKETSSWAIQGENRIVFENGNFTLESVIFIFFKHQKLQNFVSFFFSNVQSFHVVYQSKQKFVRPSWF